MRLPRWLLWTLLFLSVGAVPAAGAWWWVTWPERTVREFKTIMAANRWDEAEQLMQLDAHDSSSLIWILSLDGWDNWAPGSLQAKRRSVWYVVKGRKDYQTSSGYAVISERGKIMVPSYEAGSFESLGIIRMSGLPENINRLKVLMAELDARKH